MNIFQYIQETESDSFERAYILAEAEFDIEIAQANKEFIYESGLLSLNINDIFTEATDAKSENVFVKAFRSICNSIRNFFQKIADAFSNTFGKSENIDPNEYFKSPNSKIRFEKDVKEMDAAIDDEIRKGNSLLQKAASATGCSDAEIETWVDNGRKRLTAVAATTLPVLAAWSINKLVPTMLKRKNKAVSDAESAGSDSNNSDPKKNKQKMTIMNHISNLTHTFGETVKGWTSKLEKEVDPEYEYEKSKLKKSYSEENKKFNRGEISDEGHLKAMKKLSDAESRNKSAHEERVAEKHRKRAEFNEAHNLLNETINYLNKQVKAGEISASKRNGLSSYVNKKFVEYDGGQLSFNDYKSALDSVK